MARSNSQSRASATVPATTQTPAQTKLVVVGKVGDKEITAPDISLRVVAARKLLATIETFKGVITCEDEKLWISDQLATLKQWQATAKRELESITNPQLDIRRQSLATTKAAERIYAPELQCYETGERLLKDEILRYEDEVEQKRLLAEAELQRLALEEQRRLEEEARQQAEAAARANEEEQRKALELEQQGRQAEAVELRARADADLERAAEAVQETVDEAERVVEQAVVTSSSVNVPGQSVVGKWVADVVDVMEVLRGICEDAEKWVPVTPLEVVRVKRQGKLVPLPVFTGRLADVESIEINLAWFNVKAREQEKNFNYRGMAARFVKDLRVR